MRSDSIASKVGYQGSGPSAPVAAAKGRSAGAAASAASPASKRASAASEAASSSGRAAPRPLHRGPSRPAGRGGRLRCGEGAIGGGGGERGEPRLETRLRRIEGGLLVGPGGTARDEEGAAPPARALLEGEAAAKADAGEHIAPPAMEPGGAVIERGAAEGGRMVGEDAPAEPLRRFEEGHPHPAAAEEGRGGEPRHACAHDRHVEAAHRLTSGGRAPG